MSIDDICAEAFPIRISYSKKKVGRINSRRAALKQHIETLLAPQPVRGNEAIRFANWLREHEYKPIHGNVNWIDFSGNFAPVEQLYELFRKGEE